MERGACQAFFWSAAPSWLKTPRDLQNGREPMGKTAYKKKVKVVLRSAKAQAVARAKFKAFKKVCMEVARKHGAASRS